MKCAERFLRRYAEADWTARLILTICFAAALNFGEIFSEIKITGCYFDLPPAFRPRFFVFLTLVIASLGAFKKTVGCRVLTSAGLAGSLGIYVYWWLDSYAAFQILQDEKINFLDQTEINQTAYLYGGSWLDLGVALSLVVCLTLVLVRLCDGEKLSIEF